MKPLEDHIRKLLTLGLSTEQFAQVVLMLADVAEMPDPARERSKAGARERTARRRALQDVGEGRWYAIRAKVFQRDGRVCAYCGDRDGPHEIDHVVPLSRGGTSSMGNLAVACRTCNASKRDMLPSEWMGE